MSKAIAIDDRADGLAEKNVECSDMAAPRAVCERSVTWTWMQRMHQVEAEAERGIDSNLRYPGELQCDQNERRGRKRAA